MFIVNYIKSVRARYREVAEATEAVRQIERKLLIANEQFNNAQSLEQLRILEHKCTTLEYEWHKAFAIYSKGRIIYPLFGFYITTSV